MACSHARVGVDISVTAVASLYIIRYMHEACIVYLATTYILDIYPCIGVLQQWLMVAAVCIGLGQIFVKLNNSQLNNGAFQLLKEVVCIHIKCVLKIENFVSCDMSL